MPGIALSERGKKPGMFLFAFLNITYIMFLITAWCLEYCHFSLT
jgi:hypothetical protein